MQTYATLKTELADDGLLTVFLNRPDQLNAFTPQMAGELVDLFTAVNADDAVRAIVVTGAGRAFCSGMDLSAEGNVFVQASLLRSPSSENVLGVYEGGVTLSFEKNPKRRYLIPYFGFTTGGVVASDVPDTGFIQPVAGVHLFSHPNVQADLQGGYVFPFADVDRLHGFRAQASIRFHMW